MKQTFLAACCILLAVLCGNSLSATVRPYKFGFTIEEQQHRAEQRDELGIVMGEFGFITADGRYHVTVYATDENGKFRIISMKSFPYVAPPGKPSTTVATTTRAPPPKHSFAGAACSGCFLTNNAPAAAATSSPAQPAQRPAQHHKTEIRPLSLPLAPETITDPSTPAFGAVGNAAASNNGLAQPATNAQNSPANGQSPANSPSLAATATKTGTGSTGSSVQQPALAVTTTQSGSGSSPFGKQPALTSTQTGSSQTGEAGDLYKFKYLLDYNGHEETGSRNGDKEGNYFAIGEDSVLRTIEYIANEFGYQPRISWRRLDASEIANLPTENSLKHYEFKWFNKSSE